MKYDDVLKELDSAKKDGRIYDWKVVQDLQNRVIINIESLNSSGALKSNNYILRIKNRGEDNESCFWLNVIPLELRKDEDSTDKMIVDNIVAKVKNKEKFVYLEDARYDKDKGVVFINAKMLKEKDSNILISKRFIAVLKEDGSYDLYIDGDYGGQ